MLCVKNVEKFLDWFLVIGIIRKYVIVLIVMFFFVRFVGKNFLVWVDFLSIGKSIWIRYIMFVKSVESFLSMCD